jgi:nucleotide-binding universal stress UspA family protein
VNITRVVTGVNGSPGSLQALRYAAELARTYDAELMPAYAWTPPGGDIADRRFPNYELREVWKKAARDRLWQAVELGIGGPPGELKFGPKVIRGEAGPALINLASQPGDLLVIGAGRHGAVSRSLSARVARYCLGHAACPVIAVPPAELAHPARGRHGWTDRHRLQRKDAAGVS